MSEYHMPVTTEAARVQLADLDAFTQAYIEALCWTECNSDREEEGLDGLGFAEMTVETVATIKADCARFQAENAALLAAAYAADGYGAEEQAGHDFWLTRNRHGVGFWDRGLPEELGESLTKAAQGFGGVDVFREDFIPQEERTMSPADAWEYAATWGSLMTSGDPGACMYGFDESCLPQSEEHRADVLAWVEKCRAIVEADPDSYDSDELAKMDSFVRYIRQAPVDTRAR